MSKEKMTDNEKLVKTYVIIRDKKNQLAREYDAKDKELSNDLASIEQRLLSSCNEIGADSMRTEFGTVIKSTKESFICGDWDNFKNWEEYNKAAINNNWEIFPSQKIIDAAKKDLQNNDKE